MQSALVTIVFWPKVAYGSSFRDKVGGDDQAEKYIKDLWPHLQAYYYHKSLQTRVKIQRVGSIVRLNKTLRADSDHMGQMNQFTASHLGEANLIAYFSYGGSLETTEGILGT